jgi:hypothetical protein
MWDCLAGACNCRRGKYAFSYWSIRLIADSVLYMSGRRDIRGLPSVEGRFF